LFHYFQYIADTRLENNPWHGYDDLALKVKKKKEQVISEATFNTMVLIFSIMKH